MRVRLRWAHGQLIACLWLGGCGATPTVTEPLVTEDGDTDPVASARLFPDESDPAIAALPIVEDELLVQPYPGAGSEALSDLYTRLSATLIDRLEEIETDVLLLPHGADLRVMGSALTDSGLIEAIHKNRLYTPALLPNDVFFSRQTQLLQINAPTAWDRTTGDASVVLAIVDTGASVVHADLRDRITDTWNAVTSTSSAKDEIGHGTTVASIAGAASDNREGITGVAWDNPLMAVRVTDDTGRASARHIAAGILWSLSHGAKVINVSFAPLWSNSLVRAAATQAYHRGAIVVISSGNGGGSHAALGYAEALFVGAVTHDNTIASFSDRGPFVDLVAPGTGMWGAASGGSYRSANGTSFAAPLVSGVIALTWSINNALRPTTVMDIVTDTAMDLGPPGTDDLYGSGLVDAAAAVQRAARSTRVGDHTAPSLTVRRPSDGKVVTRHTLASVTAIDKYGVADVTMSMDGVPIATDTRKPYRFMIDPARHTEGTHIVTFIATDLSGNRSDPVSRRITIRPARGPASPTGTITFTSPDNGTRVSRSVRIAVRIADDAGLATIEWLVEGESRFVTSLSGTNTTASFLWKTNNVESGTHTVTVVVTNREGQISSGNLSLIVE